MSVETGAVGAIIVAAGRGTRMGLGYNKVLAPLCGKPVIEWTLQSFVQSKLTDSLVLVISPEDEEAMAEISIPYMKTVDLKIVYGGDSRQDSVYNGLKALNDNIAAVLIHDGARPFIDRGIIERSIRAAFEFGAACAGVPVKDTIKIVSENNVVSSTPDRRLVWSAQTPQAFKKEIIAEAYRKAMEKGVSCTDDAGIAEAAGFKVTMFQGSYRNIKLTSKEDLLLAEQFIRDIK
jgi:2-C-methyl-D-erythritol 4-phosphate cytidylyltransferase